MCVHIAFFFWQKSADRALEGTSVSVHIAFFFGWKSSGCIQVLHTKLHAGFVSITKISWKHITTNQHMIGCLKRNDNDDKNAFLKSYEIFISECSERPHEKQAYSEIRCYNCIAFFSRQLNMAHTLCSLERNERILCLSWFVLKFESVYVKVRVN